MRREYPDAPIAAVAAVVLKADQILLIRRAQEPHKGAWSLPGGAVNLGETLQQAVCREVLEETGLLVEPLRIVEALDIITRDSLGRVLYHYVLIDYQCSVRGGLLRCATDAQEAAWFPMKGLEDSGLAEPMLRIAIKAYEGLNEGADS